MIQMTTRIVLVLWLVLWLIFGPLMNTVLSQKPPPSPFQVWLPIFMSGNKESDMARVGIVHGSGDFETGDLTGFYAAGNTPEVVSTGHPVRADTYSMRAYLHRTGSGNAYRTMVIVRPDDTTPPDDPHSEFTFAMEGEYWIGLSIYIQPDLVIDPAGFTDILFQCQATPDFGEDYRQPCLHIGIDEDRWEIYVRWDTRAQSPPGSTSWEFETIVYNGALGGSIGSWTDWVIHVTWDYDADGRLKIWRDGVLVVDRNGGNCSNDTDGPYPSFGEYKWPWRPDEDHPTNSAWRLFYHDEFRIGDHTSSYADVMPGEAGPTTTSTTTVSTTSTSTVSTTSTSTVSTTSTTVTTTTTLPGPGVIDRQVNAGPDDDRARRQTSTWWSNSQAVAAVGYHDSSNCGYGMGCRFTNITIPQGATITAAYIEFKADTNRSDVTVNSDVCCEDADNPGQIASYADHVGRARTASVAWDGIGAWIADTWYQSPSIITPIQTVINRGGWSSGNALIVFWEDKDLASSDKRTCYHYEDAPANAAKLHIEYTTAGTTSTSTISTTTTTTTLPPSKYASGLIVSCERGTRTLEVLSVAEVAARDALAANLVARGF